MKSLFKKLQADQPIVDDLRRDKNDKEANVGVVHETASDSEAERESVDSTAQLGVQKAEATTQVWSRTHLIMAYVFIWIIYFVDALQQNVTGALTPYITSSFQEHSLTATTSILSSLIGGLFQLPLAKILDIWGRPQGLACMTIVLVLGLVMMALCRNVETFAAAQVFYWVGYNGLNFTLGIFVADTSALKNRGLMFAFISSPYIITTWIGGPMATSVLHTIGFRWSFGIFAIVTPIMTLPLFGLFIFNYRKAKAAGLLPVHESTRTLLQSICYYIIEFDIFGILLLAGGLAIFLLSFNLYSKQPLGFASPMIICMIVFGVVLVVLFTLYERFLAPKTFMPFDLLKDRTVLCSCILAATLFVEFYIWDSYFTSFLQVVNNVTITESSYIANIYTIGSCLWSIVAGMVIRTTGRFKASALYFGVPITILGVGLMIAFRQPDVNIGYIIMCQIFIAFGGGTLVICEQVAAMAATSHQYVAVVLAVQGMFANVGGAVGSTVAAAIWTGIFPVRLAAYLPDIPAEDLTLIYGDLATQLSYEVGTPERTAIIRAYGDAQRLMLIAATCILVLGVISVAFWRDIKVKDFKQVKGRVI